MSKLSQPFVAPVRLRWEGPQNKVELRHRDPRFLLPLLVSAVIVAADRSSKNYIQRAIDPFSTIPVIPGWLRIIHTENPGAAFGMLAEGNAIVRSAILIGLSGLVLVFVASALWRRGSSFHAPLTRFGLSLILGGAVGNLYDRIVRGTVTDFIEVYRGTWSFPAFNVADSAITVGACLLLLDMLWTGRKHSEKTARFVPE